MGNNPINSVDPDGEFVHIIAGALIGGGAAAINMAMNGELKLWGEGAGKSWAKIGIGAGTGAAIAAIPASASLLLGAGAAGGISTMGNLADQAVDLAFDGKSVLDVKNYNFKSAAIDGVISSASFGVGSGIARNMRNSAIMKNWTGPLNRSGVWKALYNNPSLAGLVSNSLTDISINGVKLGIQYYKNKNASNPGAYMVTPEEYNNYMNGGTPGFSIPLNLDEIKVSPHR